MGTSTMTTQASLRRELRGARLPGVDRAGRGRLFLGGCDRGWGGPVSQIPKRARTVVLQRDGQSCLRCGVHISVRGYSLHHRKGRHALPGMPDPHTPANLVTLCGSGTTGCHGHVHNHPEESYRAGWMILRGGSEDPCRVPVLDLLGHLWLLVDRGLVAA